MSVKNLICLLIITGLFLVGCGKKKDELSAQDAIIDTLAMKDTTDDEMFNEFYEDTTDDEFETKTDDFTSTSSPSGTPQFNPNGRYTVQVSCVLSERFAQSIAGKLEDRGYPAYVAEVQNPTPELVGNYYRIRIGGFTGVSMAREFAENYLVNDGYDYWVDNRSNDNVGLSGSGMGQTSTAEYETYKPVEQESIEYTQPVQTQQAPSQQVQTTPAPTQQAPQTTTPATTQQQQPVSQQPTQQQQQTPASQQPKEDEWGDDDWGTDTTSW